MNAETAVRSVAVVIPTHRRPRALGEALDSVLAQTRPPDVVVVIDDDDDQETRLVVERASTASGPPVRYISNERGRGASSSRNLGIAAVDSDVIAFLDDDDLWDRRYLEHAVARFESGGVQVVVTWLAEIRAGGRVPLQSIPEGLSPNAVVAVNPGARGSNICVTREACLRIGGFDESLQGSNDKDFFVRLLRSGAQYAVVRERLAFICHDADSRLTDPDGRRLASMRRYYDKHRPYCGPAQDRELRRRIRRAELRVRRDSERRRFRQHLYTVLLLVTARPTKVPTWSRLRQLVVPPRNAEST